MAEAKTRPAAVGDLKEVINMSSYFLTQMKNFSNSSEVESIFTEVEITTLETLLNETKVRKFFTFYSEFIHYVLCYRSGL